MGMRQSDAIYDEWVSASADEVYTPLFVPEEYRRLDATEGTITVRELWDRSCNGDLILQPDFQRGYVWDNGKASRYVESLLLGLPTPSIFLSEEYDGKWIVIDGHQRLATLFKYMQPLLSGRRGRDTDVELPYGILTPLRLTNLEVLAELNGTEISALPMDDRYRLWDTSLPIVRIPKTAHPDMKYVLFARLNQGSMSLNSQELRNCLYRGPYNQLIARLSESGDFLRLWGKTGPDKRMHHRELVLRFFAFLHRRDRYRTPFRAFLNDEMEAGRDLQPEDVEHYRRQFRLALDWASRVFGTEAFRQFRMGNDDDPAGKWGRRRYDLVYEVEMVGFAQFGDSLERFWNSASLSDRDALRVAMRNRLATVLTSDRFIDSINQATTGSGAVSARFEAWLRALAIVTQDFQARVQEGHVIEQTLGRSAVCARCPFPVSPDDVVLTKTDQDWEPMHRFCGQRSK